MSRGQIAIAAIILHRSAMLNWGGSKWNG